MTFDAKEYILKNGIKVIIKTPEEEDAEQLLNYIKTVADETAFLLSNSSDFNMSIEEEKNFIKSSNDGPDYLLCAYLDGKIIGDASLRVYKLKKIRHKCNLGIAIKKEYWNIGLGTLFFKIMEDLARKIDGVEQLTLEYYSKNERGKALYTKCGFKEVGVIPKSVKQLDGTYDDEVKMIKFL